MRRIWLKGGPHDGQQVVPSMRAWKSRELVLEPGGAEIDRRRPTGDVVVYVPEGDDSNHWLFWKEATI